MLRIRPVKTSDHAEILHLAKVAGIGMTSLPQDGEVLREKIEDSVLSFAGTPKKPKEEKFLLVMEDLESGNLVGTCGVLAHVGLSRPFYSYKLSLITQASQDLGIYTQQQVIHMVNDYTGASEIGSLFLDANYRKNGNGVFLSRSRFLLIAEFTEFFSDIVIAEIRGVQDASGQSPFYNNLAKHFFQMEFKDADYTHATRGGQFIADLMPKYPIYVNMLPPEAQAVISVPLAASKPAMQMLLQEGFSSEGYIDLFDAGPTVQAEKHRIRTVRKSVKAEISSIEPVVSGELAIISNCRFADFMVVRDAISYNAQSESVALTVETAKALDVEVGDFIRFAV